MPLTIGIAGLGRWGANHLRNFSAQSDCVVAAISDPNSDHRKRVETSRPGIATFADTADLLQRDDLDAVVIATPTETHAELAEAALRAGKHVLCEKPLTRHGTSARRLAELALDQNRVLMVGHVFLFNPGIRCRDQVMREGPLGRLYYLNAVRTNLGPFRDDVNAAWDLASHDVYIFNHLVRDRPESVSAVGHSYLRPPVEDIVFLTLFYPGGVIGHIHVSWLDPKKVRQLTVVGENKMLTWDELSNLGPVTIHDRSVSREPSYEDFGEFQLLAREGDLVLPKVPASEPLAAQTRAFLDRCRGTDLHPEHGSAEQGAEVVEILEAADRSLAANGTAMPVHYAS